MSQDKGMEMSIPHEAISRVLFDLDPMGTCCNENGCFDEYDGVAASVLDHLHQGLALEVALSKSFIQWFSVDINEKPDLMAALCGALLNKE